MTTPVTIPECGAAIDLEELKQYARGYRVIPEELPVAFDGVPYTRVVLHRDDQLEIVLICFAAGQTSSVHDHRGSNCVVRLLRGKILETLFERSDGTTLAPVLQQVYHSGDVSGLDGEQIHQLSNLDDTGSVLLNFYSPPFQS